MPLLKGGRRMQRSKGRVSNPLACDGSIPNDSVSPTNHAKTHRRKNLQRLAALALGLPLSACGQHDLLGGLMQSETIHLNAVLFSSYDHIDNFNVVIFDVFINGVWVGDGGSGTGVIVGAKFTFGPQIITWRLGGPEGMPRNGDTVTAKNHLVLRREDVPPGTNYIGIHIYPDETAEFNFSIDSYPPETLKDQELQKSRYARRRSLHNAGN
jgi:hypothetical protein